MDWIDKVVAAVVDGAAASAKGTASPKLEVAIDRLKHILISSCGDQEVVDEVLRGVGEDPASPEALERLREMVAHAIDEGDDELIGLASEIRMLTLNPDPSEPDFLPGAEGPNKGLFRRGTIRHHHLTTFHRPLRRETPPETARPDEAPPEEAPSDEWMVDGLLGGEGAAEETAEAAEGPDRSARYFSSRIEGGGEATDVPRRLLIGKHYRCVVGIRADKGPDQAVEISREILDRMPGQKVEVFAVGSGIDISDGHLTIDVDAETLISPYAAIDFWASAPGSCQLSLHLLVDGNTVRRLDYAFEAVSRIDEPMEIAREEEERAACDLWMELEGKDLTLLVHESRPNWRLLIRYAGAQDIDFFLADKTIEKIESEKRRMLGEYSKSLSHTNTLTLLPEARDGFWKDLEEFGKFLFSTLFLEQANKPRQDAGRQLLRLMKKAAPIRIQVIPRGLHLPWTFLWDGVGPVGLRHSVEYILDGTVDLDVMLGFDKHPLNVLCGLSPLFLGVPYDEEHDCVSAQRAMFSRLDAANCRTVWATSEIDLTDQMAAGNPDVLYLYCHGGESNRGPCFWLTRQGDAILGRNLPGEMWANSPLSIVTACESGTMDPIRSSGLANWFMGKSARGFIGVEGKVPSIFAAHFMERFMDHFLRGKRPVGEIMFTLRKEFLSEYNNPWGIVFTQCCRGEIAVH